jgi:hypothetical protein
VLEPETVDKGAVSEVCWSDADAIPEGVILLVIVDESGPPGWTLSVLDAEVGEDSGPPGLTLVLVEVEDIGPPGLTDVVVVEEEEGAEAEDIGPPG